MLNAKNKIINPTISNYALKKPGGIQSLVAIDEAM